MVLVVTVLGLKRISVAVRTQVCLLLLTPGPRKQKIFFDDNVYQPACHNAMQSINHLKSNTCLSPSLIAKYKLS